MAGRSAVTWGKSSRASGGSTWGKSGPAEGGLTWGKSGGEAAVGAVTPRSGEVDGVVARMDDAPAEGRETAARTTAEGGDGARQPVVMAGLTAAPEPSMDNGETKGDTEPVVMGNMSSAVVDPEGEKQQQETLQSGKVPLGLQRKRMLVSGGTTAAAKRRQRRAEAELAASKKMLIDELREEYAARAKVLRQEVQRVIRELREVADILANQRHRRDAQLAAELVRKEEKQRLTLAAAETVDATGSTQAEARVPTPMLAAEAAVDTSTADMTIAELEAWEQRLLQHVPEQLDERGSLTEMRTERRRARKAAKQYRAVRRLRRLRQREDVLARLQAAGLSDRAARNRRPNRKPRNHYRYAKQGNYGDVELRDTDDGKQLRVAQLRAATASNPSCLPTALLAFTKTHTQEVRLDSCAQYSIAGIELKKYGRRISKDAPADIVEGFGGGVSRVLGVWRFTGSTQYQQRITVDALLVDGQGDEFLVGEDWMVQQDGLWQSRTEVSR